MPSLRVSLSACAITVAAMLGCDEGAEDSSASAATQCTVVQAGASWWNQAFTEQTGLFHVDFSVTPSATDVDAVIGLSNGPATKWTSLAAIVRFNPQGKVDVRDGSVYRADRDISYQAGVQYNVRIDVDVQARRYSVWINSWAAGPPVVDVARDVSFRTEQLSVTRLSNVASYVNPETGTRTGGVEICGFVATADNTTADGCVIAVAGSGFTNTGVPGTPRVLDVAFRARPGASNMDGVIGVAHGDVDSYSDYAGSLRFYTNGRIEVRDGDTYRADVAAPYAAGEEYEFRMFLDLASHTYSVYASGPGLDPYAGGFFVPLALHYRFRPTQATVTTLDRVATVVASSAGRLDTCGASGRSHPKLLAQRSGSWDLLPLADGSTLMSDGAQTIHMNASHVPVAHAAFGGEVAIDAAGSFYVARIADSQLEVRSFTATLAPRWSASFPVSGAGSVLDAVVSRAGELVLLVGVPGPGWSYDQPQSMVRIGSDGRYIANDPVPGGTTAVGLGGDRFVSARVTESNGLEIGTHPYGHPTSFFTVTYWDHPVSVTKLAIAPDGSFVAAGHMYGTVNFGDGEMAPYAGPPDSGVYWDAYVVAFDKDFGLRFSRALTSWVSGLALAENEIAVAYHTMTQLPYVDHVVFDFAGNALRGSSWDAVVGPWGAPGEIALASGGRVMLNVFASLTGPADLRLPFLVVLSP
jgi:hypothetical protein